MSDRDNSQRLPVPTEEVVQKPVAKQEHQTNIEQSNGLSFASPTEFVKLPSKGRLYPEGHPLKDKEDIEIKQMTAKEEDILTSKTLLKKGIAIDRMLESIIVDKRVKLDELALGDKNALILAARATGYGPNYETTVTCPQCAEKTKNTFDLNTILEKEIPEVDLQTTQNGTFVVRLPKTNVDVEIRPLFGKDEKKLAILQEERSKTKQPENMATTQMKMFVVSIDGNTERKVIDNFIDNLPAMDSRFLRNTFKEKMPDVDMKQLFSCSKCDFEQEIEVPLTVAFFWPDR